MGAVTLSYYYCALLHPLLPLLLLSNCREERVATSGKRWLSAQCAAAAAVLPKPKPIEVPEPVVQPPPWWRTVPIPEPVPPEVAACRIAQPLTQPIPNWQEGPQWIKVTQSQGHPQRKP